MKRNFCSFQLNSNLAEEKSPFKSRSNEEERSYQLYSGNFSVSLKSPLNLVAEIPRFVAAVKSGLIDGARYFNASSNQQVTEGKCSTLKIKTKFSTKRRRVDFDHQISIFWRKGFHVKVFKTGKLLIPNCGSEEGALSAFRQISAICNIPLIEDTFQCNNQNLRIILTNEIDTKKLYEYLQHHKFQPEKTKKNRVKCKIWWNRSFINTGICECVPIHCSTLKKSEREFHNCIGSTVMFGKKSWTIFGTSFQAQRDYIVDTLKRIEAVLV